ncbi:methyltransferase, FxLD system [Nonomuraea aridisoli]|uniref:Protein-L-isoaspartate O-methyltransferase n=1 Tax=Nonomuraea aridisoli TaxID=2070368 RepID=A0A2W2EFY4_9ACTN|nr:methyltransferase, FxLD system [Nonomuraea aridisoli]PZG15769.1 methyltransferase, FxLD system [Nonomuraea aridisoli]
MDLTARRRAMVAALRERHAVSEPVAEAMLAVPRHLFVPGVDPEHAYRDQPIVTKRDAAGLPVSSSSQPLIMAVMLDQLGVEPGHRVLEIGAGTGYNAALLAHLTGPGGHVVSLDIDADTVEQARRHLSAAGCAQVEVVCADGAGGHPAGAPYDRLIATVGVWDLEPAWLDQLRPEGRLVVPLDLRGVQVSAAMERADDHWVSRSVTPCGFMRMRGAAAGPEVVKMVREEPYLSLVLPTEREIGDVAAAIDAEPRVIVVREEEHGSVYDLHVGVSLWLAVHEPRWCTVAGKLGRGYGGTAGIVEGDAVALLALEDGALLARGHGPGGDRLAADLAAHVRAWDAAGRPGVGDLRVEAHRGLVRGRPVVIEKRHTTLVLSFG